MEISAIINKSVYLNFGIILILISVKGQYFGRHRKTTPVPTQDKHVTVYAGDTAVLKCAVDNSGPKSVIWRKVSEDYHLSVGKMMYAPNDEMSIDYQEGKRYTRVNLVIKKTKPSHSGTYECQAISSDVKLHYVELTVIKERPVLKHSITLDGSVYLSPKQRLNLTCNATGTSRAPEFIDWFHEGNLIDERKSRWRNRAVIFNYVPEVPGRSLISQLTIEHVTPKDKGVYVCRSMTPTLNTGVDTTSITVHILSSDKDHMKKREGGLTKLPYDLTHHDNNQTIQNSGSFQVILIAIIFQLFS